LEEKCPKSSLGKQKEQLAAALLSIIALTAKDIFRSRSLPSVLPLSAVALW
jgi:hypothetical protein